MLAETFIIFAVLLALMIIISVLGGSILPRENFTDEVVIEDPGPASTATATAPAPEVPGAHEAKHVALAENADPSKPVEPRKERKDPDPKQSEESAALRESQKPKESPAPKQPALAVEPFDGDVYARF